jgi:tetratricopeptide (TPR) repeat protein
MRAVAQEALRELSEAERDHLGALVRHEYEEALHEFQRAIQLEAASFIAWFSLAYAYGRLLRWEEALDAYERALALTPDHAGA